MSHVYQSKSYETGSVYHDFMNLDDGGFSGGYEAPGTPNSVPRSTQGLFSATSSPVNASPLSLPSNAVSQRQHHITVYFTTVCLCFALLLETCFLSAELHCF